MAKQVIKLTESAIHGIIQECVRKLLSEMEGNDIYRQAKEHGIRCDGSGAASPQINNNGEFLKAYSAGNSGVCLCIGSSNGTRPIPGKVWERIGIQCGGQGLTMEEALRLMLKIGDYYRYF